jgi:hypothetical protein
MDADKLRPQHNHIPQYKAMAVIRYTAKGCHTKLAGSTWLMVRNSSAGPNTENAKRDNSWAPPRLTHCQRPTAQPMAMSNITGNKEDTTTFNI